MMPKKSFLERLNGQNKNMDKQITCADCGKDFIFSTSEQHFFQSKNLTEPKRCKECRVKRKQQKMSEGGERRKW